MWGHGLEASRACGLGLGSHEVACGVLLAVFGGWAMARLGAGDVAPWFAWGLLGCAGASVTWDVRGGTPRARRVRMVTWPVVMALFYFRLGVDVPRLVDGRADPLLLAWDRRWVWETPALALKAWHAVGLTEVLSACYLAYFAGYVGYLATWLAGDMAKAWCFVRGFCWIQALGFAGYCIAPASGPFMYLSEALPPLPMGMVGRFNDWVVRAGCNGVDVFPSLHVATTLYWIGFDAWQGRWRRLAFMSFPAAGLCLSTLYLRYHYAADVVAGVMIAGWGLTTARGLGRDDSVGREVMAKQIKPSRPIQLNRPG